MEHSFRLQQLFEKYLKNKCTAEELKELGKLLQENKDEDILIDQMQSIWHQKKEENPVFPVDWNRMYVNVTTSKANLYPLSQNKTSGIRRMWYRVAAVAALFVLTFSFYFMLNREEKLEIAFVEKTVPFTQTTVVLLADGSKVTLNAGSSLRYPEKFEKDERSVYLDGEGYFEITHNPKRPFIVYSGDLKTKVLGTTFNISAFSTSAKKEITVLSGKVAVDEVASGQQVTIIRKQRVTLNVDDNSFIKSDISSPEDAIGWMQNKLIFDDTSLKEVASQLSRKYGVKVSLENNQLAGCRISAVFSHQSLPEVLKVISRLTKTQYKQEGNEIKIYGKGCA